MGLPIVFVPGLMCTGRVYDHQAAALSSSHAITFAETWHDASMQEIAARILARAPGRFALVGSSMGGYVSFEIMRQAPERVAKLVLIGTSAKPDATERSAMRRQQVMAARSMGMQVGTEMLYPMLVHPSRHGDTKLKQLFIDMAEELGVEAFAREIDAIIGRADYRPTLAVVDVPTLVIVGANDALIPPSEDHEIAAGIVGASLEELSECGHMCMVERPAEVTALLADFLAT
ncbi:MAG: alpha/beta fold hydrolase [Hyphomonadaceae bacterium]|nr:alpha/beta fold hydrolase [Hyphomonadaceae bacterium]